MYASRGAVPLPGEEPPPIDLTEVPHAHDAWEIVFVCTGGGTHVTDSREYQVGRGDVFVVPADTMHFFRHREGMTHANLMYDPARLTLPWDEIAEFPGYYALFVVGPRLGTVRGRVGHCRLAEEAIRPFERMLDEMRELQELQPAGHRAMLYERFLNLVLSLCEAYAREESGDARNHRGFSTLLALLERQYHERWDVPRMAGVAAMSERTLQYRFRRTFGTTPTGYLHRLRIDRASPLLEGGSSVTDAALAVGFSDPNYFSRVFRRQTGRSPRAYARNRT